MGCDNRHTDINDVTYTENVQYEYMSNVPEAALSGFTYTCEHLANYKLELQLENTSVVFIPTNCGTFIGFKCPCGREHTLKIV